MRREEERGEGGWVGEGGERGREERGGVRREERRGEGRRVVDDVGLRVQTLRRCITSQYSAMWLCES